MSAPLPPYPPREDAWRFPPPPVGRHWLWVAIAAPVIALVIVATAAVLLVMKGTSDFPATFDDPEVISQLDESCQAMRDEVESVAVNVPPAERIEAIAEQDEAVQRMIDDLRNLDDDVRAHDQPLDDWLMDWQLLVEARTKYRLALASDSSADFQLPLDDGTNVADRIDEVAPECTVPATLRNPDRGISRSA